MFMAASGQRYAGKTGARATAITAPVRALEEGVFHFICQFLA
jgi:hypothetical protein